MHTTNNTMRKKTKTAACPPTGGDGDDPFLLLHHLPEKVMIQILVRLSVVSLLRFKCVCKSWRDLIQTSFFIDLHTSNTTFNSSSSSKFGTFILRTDNIFKKDVILMLSEYEGSKSPHEYGDWYRCTDGSWYMLTTGGGGGGDQLLLKVDNFELPSCYKLTYSKVIAGSCNGLICLHDKELRDVSLWNPATRQFRILPKSITIQEEEEEERMIKFFYDFVAFGFDVKTKDYKVLLIRNLKSNSSRPPKLFCQVQVYSLSTDSWRLLEGVNSLYQCQGLYMNGSCFFMADVYHPESNTRSRLINSFDFTKEIFTTIQFPHDDDYRQDLFLSCLGGGEKMVLFTTLRKPSSGEYDEHGYFDDGYEDCDIWVLNELNKESWTKLHSFQIKNSRVDGIPMGISNNGKFAFLETMERGSCRKWIHLYNLVTKEVKLDIPFSVRRWSKVYVYKPSLVSIIGGN